MTTFAQLTSLVNAEDSDEVLVSSAGEEKRITTVNLITKKILGSLTDKVPLNNGEWVAGQQFTAYNQYMIFNGEAYSPRQETALPYTVGATPDLGFVYQIKLNSLQALSGLTHPSDLDKTHRTEATLAKLAAGDYSSGSKLVFPELGGAKFNVVIGGIPNGYDIRDAGNGNTAQLVYLFDIRAEWLGISGGNAGSPYSGAFLRFMEISGFTGVAYAYFPDGTIYFDNTTPASFQSNCTYVGGKETVVQPTVFNQRVFLTQNKSNFDIKNIKSYINEGAGGENSYIGGGYWRFEGCDTYTTDMVEVSRSFGTAIKHVLCTDFKMIRTKAWHNQFTGVELEGCSDYYIYDYDLSYNGRYSSDNTFKPLPTGWTGTHGGRGWTAAASGDIVDQGDSWIVKGRCKFNSEYGFRCFTANTKGIKNLKIRQICMEDNGHPAGTYGSVILASDKGVDALINSDPTGESDNISVHDIEVTRSVAYGGHISWDGYNHKMTKYNFICTGAAFNEVSPINLFGAKSFIMGDGETSGAKFHISFGGNNPSDITIYNDKAVDSIKAFNGYPSSGVLKLRDSSYKHSTPTAVDGEEGISIGSARLEMDNVNFDGYWKNVEIDVAAPNARIRNCSGVNSAQANSDLWAASVTDQTNLELMNNDFKAAFPGILASFTNFGIGPLGRRRAIWNSNPTNGGQGAGSLINWDVGDRVENSASAQTWVCTVAGTPGTWV